jgi:uncharacterized membrane protein YkoI
VIEFCRVILERQNVDCSWNRPAKERGATMGQWVLHGTMVVILTLGLVGCSSTSGGKAKKERPAEVVTLADLPAPARATVEKLMGEGKIKKIEKTVEDGTIVYEVEGTAGGKNVEYDIGTDGKVLTSEQSIPYETLPAAPRMTAVLYFGSAEELAASKEVEGDKTFYEVQGKKDGATVTVKMTDLGKIVEEEKE